MYYKNGLTLHAFGPRAPLVPGAVLQARHVEALHLPVRLEEGVPSGGARVAHAIAELHRFPVPVVAQAGVAGGRIDALRPLARVQLRNVLIAIAALQTDFKIS